MKLSRASIILIVLIALVLAAVFMAEQRVENKQMNRALLNELYQAKYKQEPQPCDSVYVDFYNNLLDVTQSYEPLRDDVYRCFNENPDGLAHVLLKTDGASGDAAARFMYELSKTHQYETLDMLASIEDDSKKEKLIRMLAYEYVYRCDFTMMALIEQDSDIVHPVAENIWHIISFEFTEESKDCFKMFRRRMIPVQAKPE